MSRARRTAVYVDAFNLYYGCLKGTPFKWLDVHALARLILPRNDICLIKYFTARVKASRRDPHAPARQRLYLKALAKHIPHLRIVEGRFLRVETNVEVGPGRIVRGWKSEEKGSDVNLAVHLLNDAWRDEYEVGVVVSNDTDLAAAMSLTRNHCGKVIGLVSPVSNTGRRVADHLSRSADFQRTIRKSALRKAQLPSPIPATRLYKPVGW